jgi:hypothetical protein
MNKQSSAVEAERVSPHLQPRAHVNLARYVASCITFNTPLDTVGFNVSQPNQTNLTTMQCWTERLCQQVCWILFRSKELHFNISPFNRLAYIVESDIDVFDSGMELWIFTDGDRTFVIST